MARALPVDLAQRSPEEGARLIALFQLARVREAARKAGRELDEPTLHALRTSIRRLRATLAAYHDVLPRRAARRARRGLARIMSATSPARDVEVALDALPDLASPARVERYALGWLVRRWHRLERRGLRRVRRLLEDELPQVLRRLRRALHRLRVDGRSPRPTLLAHAATIIGGRVEALRGSIDEAGARLDDRALHRARLDAKRLRYVLEPLAEVIPGLRGPTAPLVALQDLLGGLRDRRLLAARIDEDAARAPRALVGELRDLAAAAGPG